MASTPQVAALGRRSSNRLTVVILVLIAVVVIVGLTVAGHQVGELRARSVLGCAELHPFSSERPNFTPAPARPQAQARVWRRHRAGQAAADAGAVAPGRLASPSGSPARP
jgi:hypothetical protein